jgi:hypothetical protein
MLATKKIQCEFCKGFFSKKNAKLLDFEGKKLKVARIKHSILVGH